MKNPEEAIIVSSLHSDGVVRLGKLLESPDRLDWPRILHLAQRHHLVPCLLENIRASGIEIPLQPLQLLNQLERSISMKNLAQTGRLLEILEAFESANLRVYPYKGPFLSHLSCGSFTKRSFQDLDILVPESEAVRAAEVLEGLGYEACFPWVSLDTFVPFHYEYRFCHSFSDQIVELKWKVCSTRFRAWSRNPAPWRDFRPKALKSRRCHGPGLEELFVILVIHGTKHCWSRLLWLGDLAGLIAHGLDWQEILSQAQFRRANRPLALALGLLQRRLGVELPDYVSNWASSYDLTTTSGLVEKGWFHRRGLAKLDEKRALYSLLETWSQRMEYTIGTLLYPTPSEFLALPYELPYRFLYFIVRPLRYLAKILGLNILQDPRVDDRPPEKSKD